MIPDQIIQNHGTNVVSAALVLVGSMSGTDEKVLPFFKVFGGGIVELLLAIGAEHQSRKRAALTSFRSSVPLLTNVLHLVKDFLRNNGRMGVVENNSIFFGISPLLFVSNGIGVGLEIDRCTDVLFSFKNIDNGAFVPAVRVLRLGVQYFHTLLVLYAVGVSTLSFSSWSAIWLGPRPFMQSMKIFLTTCAASSSIIHSLGFSRFFM